MRIVLIGVLVYLRFFERLLVFELLSILYITLANSAAFAGKQRNLALQNMPLTLTCSD